jgi:hypothetical protein
MPVYFCKIFNTTPDILSDPNRRTAVAASSVRGGLSLAANNNHMELSAIN